MKEYWADFSLAFDAKSDEERDEIIERLKKALTSTEWKVRDVQCDHCEEA